MPSAPPPAQPVMTPPVALAVVGAIMLSFALLVAPIRAADLEEASRLYEAGDYRAAYALFHTLARQKEATAQYHVGVMYLNGQGVPQDIEEAVEWLRQAALAGVLDAAATLGKMYASGLGVEMNMEEAAKWIERAAEIAEAQGLESDC